jgi:hypothetical protein
VAKGRKARLHAWLSSRRQSEGAEAYQADSFDAGSYITAVTNPLTELAAMYNPCIRGWITYYGHFYKTQLR